MVDISSPISDELLQILHDEFQVPLVFGSSSQQTRGQQETASQGDDEAADSNRGDQQASSINSSRTVNTTVAQSGRLIDLLKKENVKYTVHVLWKKKRI